MSLYTKLLADAASADALFPDNSAIQAASLDNRSKMALSQGLDFYTKKHYDEAIVALKRTVGLAPNSSQAIDAYNYIAQSYVQKGDSRSALNAYQQSLRVDPGNAETYVSIGNLHYSDGNYAEAQKAYAKAVKFDPSANNHYSLGQAYLALGQYADSQHEFQQVQVLTPTQPNGEYGMGQVYAKQGDTTQAISAFDKALKLQSNFWLALSDKAYALVDSGDTGGAQDIATSLANSNDPNATKLAPTLTAYIYEKSPPAMTATYGTGSFPWTLGGGTQVAALGLYDAGDSQTFSMVFQFSKQMDAASVQNVFNWQISRATATRLASGYNSNLPVPTTEISPPVNPTGVSYNPTDMTATVFFTLQQNATDDGTIDPSHIQFSFSGKDAAGITMDPMADQFTGISGFA